jgi:YHS domain-containing protein
MKVMNMRYATAVMMLVVATVIGGCASRKVSSGPHAECLVCKCNADLACVDIEVDATTPRTVIDGKTYYFCSNACKAKFEKDPRKFEAYAK